MRSSLLALAALGAFAAGGTQAAYMRRPAQLAGLTFPSTMGIKGAGITMAQQKRNAKKSRNIKRHKAACRG